MKTRSKLPSFRIAVVGSGAIGCYYGAKLARAGRDVYFLMRGDVSEIRRDGILVRGRGEKLHVPKVKPYATTEEIGPCELVLVAVKTTSNADLLKLIPPLLHRKTMLLTLQNGLGNEEFLAQNFGAERVLGGLCFVCLNRVSRGVIEHYDHGRVAIGEYKGEPKARTHEVVSHFQAAGVVCRAVENVELERWRKLVWNIPFNSLAVTAGGIDTAAILDDKQLRAQTVALMNETIAAANKCGFSVPASDAAAQIKRTEAMGAYKPSTLIDFEAGRPLEIEAIWGEPLRRATAAGAAVPRLKALYQTLNALNQTRRSEAAITVHDRQRGVRVKLMALQKFAERALQECLKIPTRDKSALASLPAVNVILVSDRRMAELHRRFLDLPGPTDVITFQHGEIFISTKTARRNAARFGKSFDYEMRLYIAHGLLHLHRFDDKKPAAAAKMKRAQEKLVATAAKATSRPARPRLP